MAPKITHRAGNRPALDLNQMHDGARIYEFEASLGATKTVLGGHRAGL